MKKLNVLVIGSGGREHSIAWKIKQSSKLNSLFVAPGNGGTSELAKNLSLNLADHKQIIDICKQNKIDLVVIGPDDILASGLADDLIENNILVFGPTKKATQIESSKSFAKNIMKSAGVHTARYREFTNHKKAVEYLDNIKFPIVIKADGLALGKGVVICKNKKEAQKALGSIMKDKVFGKSGDVVIIEEFLHGQEVSLHAISDGNNYVMFPSSQDHKPIGEGDTGLNTGGMGTIAPVPWLSHERTEQLGEQLVGPILKELKTKNSKFSGLLYPGLMLTKQSYNVIEYNARFGDPETQSYMRLLKSDLLEILIACAKGDLASQNIEWADEFACCIVLASGGYPGDYNKGEVITGIAEAEELEEVVIFHAGTRLDGDKLVTNGGRVLNVTATGNTLEVALTKAYKAVKKIHFKGMQYRTDIGKRPPLIK